MKIEAIEIHVEISGWAVLNGANVSLEQGQVHSLVGDNGSGKSTLLHVLSGFLPKGANISKGQLLIDGEDIRSFCIDRKVAKIRRIYLLPQDPPVVDGLSVLDFVFLGAETSSRWGLNNRKQSKVIFERLLRTIGWALNPEDRCSSLTLAERQKAAVARVLLLDPPPNFLLFDEPTTHLAAEDIEAFLAVLRRLATEKGIGVVLVSHEPHDVLDVSDRASIVSDGRVLATYDCSNPVEKQDIVRYFARRPLFTRKASPGPPLLTVTVRRLDDGLGREKLKDISFTAHAGEILGVSCQDTQDEWVDEDLFGILTGLIPQERFDACVSVRGQDLRIVNAGELRRRGCAFIPARKEEGLIPGLTVQENLLLTRLDPALWIWDDQSQQSAHAMCKALHIHEDRLLLAADCLSGGYQQRVVLARELASGADIVVMHNPTQGLDSDATKYVCEGISRIQEKNGAVLLLSSDREEIETLSTRQLHLHAN
jgi:ABC-type sugar transport system ATPase subunit